MSYQTLRIDLESIDRVALGSRANVRLLHRQIGDIDGQRKQVFKGVYHADILKNVHRKFGVYFDDDIYVAVGAMVAPRP